METRKQFIAITLLAIIALAIIGCGGDDKPTTETFTVTFHANGGTPEPPNQTIEKGKTVSEPTAMTKVNSDFEGWYKESGFTTKWNFANGNGVAADIVTTNIDLHAKWTPYYGTLPNGVKIYKGDATITDTQMTTATQNVIAGYNMLEDPTWKAEVDRVLTKIVLISDKNYTWDGYTLGLKYSFDADSMLGFFEMVGDKNIPLTTN
jgi:uncharacterized repeat protein (TIGR02543 family)